MVYEEIDLLVEAYVFGNMRVRFMPCTWGYDEARYYVTDADDAHHISSRETIYLPCSSEVPIPFYSRNAEHAIEIIKHVSKYHTPIKVEYDPHSMLWRVWVRDEEPTYGPLPLAIALTALKVVGIDIPLEEIQ
jgi:hypothetical protein